MTGLLGQRLGARTVAIPRLLHVGTGSLAEVGALLRRHDFDTRRVLVASGPGPSRAYGATVSAGLHGPDTVVVEVVRTSGELVQAADLAARVISDDITLAVAVGGGRVIDTVKLAAARTGTDFISVPTTIAHDGISSPVASLATSGRRQSHAAAMPAGIVVDTDVIADAPPGPCGPVSGTC